jgi:Cu/Ag efflux pump CusA
MPGISIADAQKLLLANDRIIKQFPEIDRVLERARIVRGGVPT